MQRTGYGSAWLERISPVARASDIPGTGWRVLYRRLRAGLAPVLLYLWTLPRVRVPLSSEPTGRLIRDQLRTRRAGRIRYRHAQGVLFLPRSYGDYLRGRSRQAVRTNIRRAREAGLRVEISTDAAWSLQHGDPRYVRGRAPAPVEIFTVRDGQDASVGEALLTVDRQVALLQVAFSSVTHARWLLHATIVERLCGRCELMIVNAEDVPLLSRGAQHYQRLLGYSIVRLALRPTVGELLGDVKVRLGLLCTLGAAAMVAGHWILLGAGATFGERALAWLSALVLVRRTSHRAGPAALTGLLAASGYLCVEGVEAWGTAAGWAVAAVALDALLALRPRLTHGSLAVAPAGTIVAVLALLVSELASAADPARDLSRLSLWSETVILGAIAAGLGWWVGGRVLNLRLWPARA